MGIYLKAKNHRQNQTHRATARHDKDEDKDVYRVRDIKGTEENIPKLGDGDRLEDRRTQSYR